MKRLRTPRWSGNLLVAPSRPTTGIQPSSLCCRQQQRGFHPVRPRLSAASAVAAGSAPSFELPFANPDTARPLPPTEQTQYPSPVPERALSSAKLAALHARLALSEKVPLQTLARCLVDPSADPHPNFNNANLAYLGQTLISYHVGEHLVCRHPRLPVAVLYEATRAYAGHGPLQQVALQWGVDSAAVPGGEVDPGLLQWAASSSEDGSGGGVVHARWGYVRKEAGHLDRHQWRRGVSSRVVLDDDFGDAVHAPAPHLSHAPPRDDAAAAMLAKQELRAAAHAAFVRAVVGAVYAHCGREAAKSFVRSHVLSRKLELHRLFAFKLPTRELTRLCAREGFEPPVARLLSETGRLSRTPVFVVGIYSGRDKLGEGAGPSLNAARAKAAMNALLSWYLYSPGLDVPVPSDVLAEGAAPWKPAYIDIGEIV